MNVKETGYRVSWRHEPPKKNTKMSSGNFKVLTDFHGASSCFIHKYVNGDKYDPLVSVGRVEVYYKDRFSKEQGRRHSMRRALNNSDIPRNLWSQFWISYKNR